MVTNNSAQNICKRIKYSQPFFDKLSLESVNKFEFERWDSSQNTHWEGIVEVVGRQGASFIFHNLKLLHQTSEKEVELFFCQCLAKAYPLSNSKRSYSVIRNKLPISIQKPVWIECVWILEVFGIIHDVVQTSKDNSTLRYDVIAHRNICSGVMRDSWGNNSSCSEAFLEDSIDVVEFGPVIQTGKSVLSNNLKVSRKFKKPTLYS